MTRHRADAGPLGLPKLPRIIRRLAACHARRSRPRGGLLYRRVPSQKRCGRHIRRFASFMFDQRLDRRSDAYRSSRRDCSSSRRRAPSSSSCPSLAFRTADFSTPNRLVIDLDRHRKRMTILAAVGEGKSRRIAEAIRRTVQHLRHHRQGAHSSRADAGNHQKLGKFLRPAIRRGGEGAMQPASETRSAARRDGRA